MLLVPSCIPPVRLSCICVHAKQCCYKSVRLKEKWIQMLQQKTHTRPRNTHKLHSHWASKCVAACPINQRCPADVVNVSTSASCWRICHTSVDIYRRSLPLESTETYGTQLLWHENCILNQIVTLSFIVKYTLALILPPLTLNQHTLLNIYSAPPSLHLSANPFFISSWSVVPTAPIFCCWLWSLVFIMGLGLVVLRLTRSLTHLSLADYFCIYTFVCVCVCG